MSLIRTLLMGKRCIESRDFSYYLLEDDFDTFGHSYGVEIAAADGEDDVCIHGITLSQSKILLLLALLMHSRVTPVSLHDVVDDWLLA